MKEDYGKFIQKIVRLETMIEDLNRQINMLMNDIDKLRTQYEICEDQINSLEDSLQKQKRELYSKYNELKYSQK